MEQVLEAVRAPKPKRQTAEQDSVKNAVRPPILLFWGNILCNLRVFFHNNE